MNSVHCRKLPETEKQANLHHVTCDSVHHQAAMSALPVGNEAARDDKKHCAAFILRSAICEVIPSVGALLIVHYDKRGAKVTMEYAGEDCELNATVLELGCGQTQCLIIAVCLALADLYHVRRWRREAEGGGQGFGDL